MPQRFGVRFGMYYDDSDQEIGEEITPDPFSEEPRSLAHKERYKCPKVGNTARRPRKKEDNGSNI